MFRVNRVPPKGWALLDAVLALAVWSSVGIGLMMQTHVAMQQQSAAWRYDQALQWQADVLERLRLSRVHTPVVWALGERMTASSCTDAPCRASDWRDSLLADWYTRLSREMPQVQVWMSPWASDPRLQLIGLRWPEATPSERLLPLNQTCPVGWQCLVGLGWP